ncbi:hypothetical protein B0H13DRAFT_1851376 [Mycena leptocephala]|nr:hypothetical protein B0H13DRAFT_1851376 [Mycena leptocephala]
MVGGVAILFARFYTWRIRIFPEETHKQHMGDRAVDGRHPRPAPTAYRSVKHAGPLCPLPSCHSCRPTTRHAIPTAYTICVEQDGFGEELEEYGGEEWGDGWGREWESGVDAAECEGCGGMVWAVIGSGGRDGARAGGREGGVNGREREREGTREQEMDGGGSPVSISISAPLLVDGGGHGFGGAPGGLNGLGIGNGRGKRGVRARPYPFAQLHPQAVQSAPGHWGPQSRRKGSTDEVEPERERDGKDKEKSGVAFPFHFGGAAAQSKPLPPAHSPLDAPLLAPPHIILEPASPAHDQGGSCASTLELHAPVAPGGDGKRAPQIVYAAGFVNHLATPALSDPHVRKAFDMELCEACAAQAAGGSCGGGWGEEEEAAGNMEEGGGVGQRREPAIWGRKKRAYWGRGRYPALGVAGAGAFALGGVFSREGTAAPKGRIEKGTLEALIHGLVFATVFLQTALEAEEAARREESGATMHWWSSFASRCLSTTSTCGFMVDDEGFGRGSSCAGVLRGGARVVPVSLLAFGRADDGVDMEDVVVAPKVEAPRAPPAPTLTFPGMESIVVTAVLKFPELPVSFTPADCAAWLATAARIIPETRMEANLPPQTEHPCRLLRGLCVSGGRAESEGSA